MGPKKPPPLDIYARGHGGRWPHRRAATVPPMPPHGATASPSAIAASPKTPTVPRVTVIVPFRPGNAHRERNWRYVQARYAMHHPEWLIVTAEGPEGPFSRSGAVRDGLTQARGDVVVIADADVWSTALDEAVALVRAGARWANPARTVVYLTERATRQVIEGNTVLEDAERTPDDARPKVPCGGAVVLSRDVAEACPPDARFTGWGAEDNAWTCALETLYGPPAQLPGRLWHLWHPAAKHDDQLVRANTNILDGYRAAAHAPQEMRALIGQAQQHEPPAGRNARPRVLIIADVPNWAWGIKARQLKQHLSESFDIGIAYLRYEGAPDRIPPDYDLYHTFEVNQLERVRPLLPRGARATTGITAHVWRTWEEKEGAGTIARWAAGAPFHANSRLLQVEMEALLKRRIHYVPNGVDADFFKRTRPRAASKLVVGFVGKPNPRKGHHIVVEACRRAGVELRAVTRRSTHALPPEEMREFYQDIHVLAVASDMDGTPNPALEAAACECTVVSNAIGNMPEFIRHGVNGFLIDRDASSIADALKQLAGNVPHAEAMGRAARQTIEAEWTWREMSRHYAMLWQDALA